jgi:hypothetical protein
MFRGPDCVSEYLGEILSIGKRAAQMFDMERYNLKKLNEVEVKEQYQVKASGECAALENLVDNADINRLCDSIGETIGTSAKGSIRHFELAQHKPCFDEEFSKLLHQTKQSKLQHLQNPSQVNGDNLNDIRHSRNFRNKKEYLKDKINELEANSKDIYIYI